LVGAELEGRVELPAKAAAAGEVSAELACIRVWYTRGSEGGISTKSQDVWSDRRRFPIQRSTTGGTALVLFPIPGGIYLYLRVTRSATLTPPSMSAFRLVSALSMF